MPKDKRKDPSALFWDLIVERSRELIPGMNGFIGRAHNCLFQIWEGYDPDRHDEDDYRTQLGNAVSRYHDFLRIEPNGSIRITHRTDKPTYIVRENRRSEFPFPNSTDISDYHRLVKSLRKSMDSLQTDEELYLFSGDLLVLSGGYGFEIRDIKDYHRPNLQRLEDTQVIYP